MELMKTKHLLATAVLMGGVLSTDAIVITLENIEYEISFIQSSIHQSLDLLTDQPWWGNATLGESAALQVGPPPPGQGYLFALFASEQPEFFSGSFLSEPGPPASAVTVTFPSLDDVMTFAIATRVPIQNAVPDGGPSWICSILALGAVTLFARRPTDNAVTGTAT
jgi:hypothetical protein